MMRMSTQMTYTAPRGRTRDEQHVMTTTLYSYKDEHKRRGNPSKESSRMDI
jgi:hypothetical protein